jgi:formamidopyrimidine-DNA glycosylase
MPEMPEVETVRRLLATRVTGKRIQQAAFDQPVILKQPSLPEFVDAVSGTVLSAIDRRGKYLLFRLTEACSNRAAYDLIVHFKMRGSFRIEPETDAPGKYLCAALNLEGGVALRFYDMWRWGEWVLLPSGKAERELAGLAELGLEPFDPAFTTAYLREELNRRCGLLKPILLGQRVVAGLGNIYCDECLHRARLHPSRKTQSLTEGEAQRLHEAIGTILHGAIARGSARAKMLASQGENLDSLEDVYAPQVYDQPGKPCPVCGTPLNKMQLRGRGTTFCPVCQPSAERN